jgi:flagellar basal-body rod protein FlgB
VDVDFHSVLQQAFADGSEEAVETVAHDVSFEAEVDGAATMRLDGGTVDLDVEASKLSQNGLEYQALVSVAHARVMTIQSAIRGN